jgi:hypothetical protein
MFFELKRTRPGLAGIHVAQVVAKQSNGCRQARALAVGWWF